MSMLLQYIQLFSSSGPDLGSYFWVSPAQIDALAKTLTLNPFTLAEHKEPQTTPGNFLL